DTPAEKAGMQAGDVILSVAGEEISRIGDISQALHDHEAGDKVPVKVLRDGSQRTLDVELEERPGMSRRSIVIDDGDDDSSILVLPPEAREEMRKALDESMRGLKESLKELHLQQDQMREQIRHELRDTLRDVRRARVVSTSY